MTLEEFFKRLSLSELSNLAIGESGSGEIQEGDTNKEKLVGYTNEALLRLYTRFPLKQSNVLIQQYAHITHYHLSPEFAQTQNRKSKKIAYILDLHCAAFTGDVLKILEVWDSFGCSRPLNDAELHHSVFTPMPDTLQVPYPVAGQALSINYQAAHEPLTIGAMKRGIKLPLFLEAALQKYVAHLVFSHMNGQENLIKSQEYLAAYESICVDVEAKDQVNATVSTTTTKFHKRGFV